MSLEDAIGRNSELLARNNELLEQLIAGREDALAKLAAATDKPARTPRAKKGDEAPPTDSSAVSGTASAAATKTPETIRPTVDVSDDAMRKVAGDYIGQTDDKAERADRGGKVKSILDHFGTKTLVGPEGITDEEQRRQAVFFIERFKAGLPVNFSEDYDFDGDPTAQGGERPVAEGGDEFDIG